MINTVKTSFFLLVALVLSACTDSRKLETIRQAEMLMQEQPDSALRVLQTINRHSLRGEILARYALIYSIAQDKSGLDVTNDSLLRIAYEYYSQHPGDSLYARSQYYMGLYYTLVDSTKQAEDCLRTAIRYAEERKEYYTQYLALDRLSSQVRYSDAPLALDYSKQALDIYSLKCIPNFRNQIILMQNIAKEYILCSKEDSALYYMDMALDKASLHTDSNMIGAIMQEKSLVYFQQQDYQRALSFAKDAWRISPVKSPSLAFCLASCYSNADSITKARDLYMMLFKTGNYEQRYLAYKDLAVLSAKEHGDSLFQTYSDSAFECMEAIYKQQMKTKAAYYNDVIQLEEDKLHEEIERLRAESRWKLSATCLVFSLLLLTLIVWLFIKYHRAKKAEIEHQKIQNRSLEELNKKEEERFRAEKARLLAEETMLRKDKEQKEQIMEQTRQYVRNIVHFQQKIEEIQGTKKHLVFDTKDWEEIQAYLEACDNSFVTRFKEQFPDISEGDFQFCMLLRCGFTNPDLEKLYSRQTQVIKNKQNLLRKKLGLKEEELSLRQYIKNF